ncbi:hypothetical protein [Xanthomonas fragariae]|uniref:hypothetical protein n=1 Tax=Xanthomonas fragariae TaxID=48664 RepID=UPI000D54BD3B|nr:hypothetical protein [Xanthomonas fragariae]MEA5249915.1 hypothetical protein [Xanthomonas fragariae]
MKICRFLDDFIVVIAKTVIHAVFALGTGVVYVQFVGGLLLTIALSTVALVMVVSALSSAILGV